MGSLSAMTRHENGLGPVSDRPHESAARRRYLDQLDNPRANMECQAAEVPRAKRDRGCQATAQFASNKYFVPECLLARSDPNHSPALHLTHLNHPNESRQVLQKQLPAQKKRVRQGISNSTFVCACPHSDPAKLHVGRTSKAHCQAKRTFAALPVTARISWHRVVEHFWGKEV